MVVLDPLVVFCGGGNMNDNAVMSLVMRKLKGLAIKYDCALLVVHHTRKGGDLTSPEAISGAAAIVNLARRAIMPVAITNADRKSFGVLPSEQYRYLKVIDAKSNLAPRSADSPWYDLHNVELPNSEPPIYPREIAGFAQTDGVSWEYYVEHDTGKTVIWEGMTEAGHLALRKVMSGRRVAIQPVSLLPYVLEERLPAFSGWQPVVLFPLRAANVDTPRFIFCWPDDDRDDFIAAGPRKGSVAIGPSIPLRCATQRTGFPINAEKELVVVVASRS